jgi:cytidine deaminase
MTVASCDCRAIGLGASGRLYVGVNLEFPGLPLQHSVHAEQFLITLAAAKGERGLTRISVNAAPCGHCRQFIAELVTAVRLGPPPSLSPSP